MEVCVVDLQTKCRVEVVLLCVCVIHGKSVVEFLSRLAFYDLIGYLKI